MSRLSTISNLFQFVLHNFREKSGKSDNQITKAEAPTPKLEPITTSPVPPKPSPPTVQSASDPVPSKLAPPPPPPPPTVKPTPPVLDVKPTPAPISDIKPAPTSQIKPTPPPVADVKPTQPPVADAKPTPSPSEKPTKSEVKSIPKYADSDKIADDVLKSSLRIEGIKQQAEPKPSPKEQSLSFTAAEAAAEQNARKPRVVQEVKREEFEDQEGTENEEAFDYGDELEDEEDDEQEYELQQRIRDHLRSIQQDQPSPQAPTQVPKSTELKNTKESFPKNTQGPGDFESDEEVIEDIDSLDDEEPEITVANKAARKQ